MRRFVMSRSTATLREAKRPSYTTVVSFKSEISGRTAPDLSSDMNGSRPPPSYANTSRSSETGCCAVVSRSGCWAAAATAGPANAASSNAVLAARTRRSRLRRRRRRGSRRLDEGSDRELREQQRARGVAQQLLHGRRGHRERDVLRHDDARQGRDVGEVLADLVVVAVHLEPVPVRVERRAGLGSE